MILLDKTYLLLFRGLIRRQTNTDDHDPEVCQGKVDAKCPLPNFESAGPQVTSFCLIMIPISVFTILGVRTVVSFRNLRSYSH